MSNSNNASAFNSINFIKNSQDAKNKNNLVTNLFSTKNIRKYWNDQKPPENSSKPFEDIFFPSNNISLYGKPNNPKDPQYLKKKRTIEDLEIEWRRPMQIFQDEFLLFEDKIEFADIMQGSLGNCYFLSAIAALSEFPNLIYKIFRSKEVSSNNVYEIALFVDGEWQIVIVDDYIPYSKKFDCCAFARPNGNELWVLLLEKAWAKINGSYLNIIGGLSCDPLTAFTGFYVSKLYTEDIKDEKYLDKFWKTIVESDEKNYIMCCDSKGDEECRQKNIVKSHAYTLIGAKEVNYKGEKIRLCKMRNPWGNKEWNGSWSDTCPRWNDELNSLFGHNVSSNEDLNDGIFFISIEDLTKYFGVIHICCYMYNSNVKTFEIIKENFEKPQIFSLYIKEKANVSISTHAPFWRYNRHLVDVDHPISILLAKLDEENNKLVFISGAFSSTEDSSIIKELEAGFYIIWAYHSEDEKGLRHISDYNLKICTETEFQARHVQEDEDFKLMREILLDGIKANYKKEIDSKESFSIINKKSFKDTGFVFYYRSNRSEENFYKANIQVGKMEGYYVLPPYNNKKSFSLIAPPGEDICIFGIQNREYGSFCFNLAVSSVAQNGPFKEDNNNPKFSLKPAVNSKNQIFNDEKIKLQQEIIDSDYYQFISLESSMVHLSKTFNKIDKHEASKIRLSKSNPKEMELVLKLEPLDSSKNSIISYEWKKIIVANGYYIAEVRDEEFLFGRAIFVYISENENSACNKPVFVFNKNAKHLIGYYLNNIKQGPFEEYSEKGELLFKGNYSNGKKNGKGFCVVQEGYIYEGNYVDDVKQGLGKLTFPKGSVYIGEFSNDKMNGKGTYYFKPNEFWQGNFVDNKKHGMGVYTFPSGNTKNVAYVDNKPVIIKNEVLQTI